MKSEFQNLSAVAAGMPPPTLDEGLTLLVKVDVNALDQLTRLREAIDTLAGPRPLPVKPPRDASTPMAAVGQLFACASELEEIVQDIGHEITRLRDVIGNRGVPSNEELYKKHSRQ